MKKSVFAIALLLCGTAVAQTADPAATAYEGDGAFTTVYETEGGPGGAYVDPTLAFTAAPDGAVAASGMPAPATTAHLVQPSNADPERDARGIAVISAAAVAPAGWNGVPASATGGPELDPATGEAAAPASYPACTATVTDKCLQTYEVGRR
jgi:hypothetical protein